MVHYCIIDIIKKKLNVILTIDLISFSELQTSQMLQQLTAEENITISMEGKATILRR